MIPFFVVVVVVVVVPSFFLPSFSGSFLFSFLDLWRHLCWVLADVFDCHGPSTETGLVYRVLPSFFYRVFHDRSFFLSRNGSFLFPRPLTPSLLGSCRCFRLPRAIDGKWFTEFYRVFYFFIFCSFVPFMFVETSELDLLPISTFGILRRRFPVPPPRVCACVCVTEFFFFTELLWIVLRRGLTAPRRGAPRAAYFLFYSLFFFVFPSFRLGNLLHSSTASIGRHFSSFRVLFFFFFFSFFFFFVAGGSTGTRHPRVSSSSFGWRTENTFRRRLEKKKKKKKKKKKTLFSSSCARRVCRVVAAAPSQVTQWEKKGPPNGPPPPPPFRMKCCRWNSTLPDADDFLRSSSSSSTQSFSFKPPGRSDSTKKSVSLRPWNMRGRSSKVLWFFFRSFFFGTFCCRFFDATRWCGNASWGRRFRWITTQIALATVPRRRHLR